MGSAVDLRALRPAERCPFPATSADPSRSLAHKAEGTRACQTSRVESDRKLTALRRPWSSEPTCGEASEAASALTPIVHSLTRTWQSAVVRPTGHFLAARALIYLEGARRTNAAHRAAKFTRSLFSCSAGGWARNTGSLLNPPACQAESRDVCSGPPHFLLPLSGTSPLRRARRPLHHSSIRRPKLNAHSRTRAQSFPHRRVTKHRSTQKATMQPNGTLCIAASHRTLRSLMPRSAVTPQEAEVLQVRTTLRSSRCPTPTWRPRSSRTSPASP
jgi:hypothetical protein